MVTKGTYCCAGSRWLGRHTGDCELPLDIFDNPAVRVVITETSGNHPKLGPAILRVGEGER